MGPVKTGDVMECGIKIEGKEIDEAHMKVEVKDKGGKYEYTETY